MGLKVIAETEYREVDGFPMYRVGTDGSVWTKWLIRSRWRDSGDSWVQCRFQQQEGRYIYIYLYGEDGRVRREGVHVLVLEVFSGSRPNGMQACHNDGNRQNNALSNLRWDTIVSNHDDKRRHGTMCRGQLHYKSLLTEESVREIRRLASQGEGVCEIARRFGVRHSCISKIVSRKSWRHVL